MQIQSNVSLRHLNTFGLDAEARYFAGIRSVEELTALLHDPQWKDFPKFILGGGSNILLTKDIEALVIHPDIRGIEILEENDESVVLKVGAGEVWHNFVMFCVGKGYGGVENLSLIPGTVGAAPMQNIGAYGVEIKSVIESVEAVDIATGEKRVFSNTECEFGYRESIFKKALKNRYIITGAVFKLNKKPILNAAYGDVQKTLQEMGVAEPTIRDISEAIMQIRRSKLPDPAEIGNAGSFFKNPEIPLAQFDQLKETFPEMPGYPVDALTVKVPAGWLIEKAGWKGFREGNIGVHARQALVLVNYGGGTGAQIRALSEKIQASVAEKFGVRLNAEVNFI
ncbi:UDP-N-acetylenolpyruvoylglucosamine reductase [Dyadobacter beijingensis]|uniref:UDP-N-acetylenolpyruvoylglucosamine reductase n=1 Tax=Dyadobacter beijingensis TaxID=365489 RepID=A0ABQ2IL21_9BACT|nr:UDP-N-acetylmuramate dehydrogenase [Dyadobacter beijingensis]GGN14304.1 UDP-N-acetylenolpyruvoylglucosamine reductase [Dyadobacter beijingensis]